MSRKTYRIELQKNTAVLAELNGNRSTSREVLVPESTIRGWKKRFLNEEESQAKKRGPKGGKYPQLEKKLVDFIYSQRNGCLPVSVRMAKEKAEEFTKELEIHVDFKASHGWFRRFVSRNNLSMRRRTSDGRKLPPYVILDRKTVPVKEGLPDGVVRARAGGWMDSALVVDWMREVWMKKDTKEKSLFVLDSYRGHLTFEVRETAGGMETELVFIPGGLTGKIQPLDKGVNKPFKDRLTSLHGLAM